MRISFPYRRRSTVKSHSYSASTVARKAGRSPQSLDIAEPLRTWSSGVRRQRRVLALPIVEGPLPIVPRGGAIQEAMKHGGQRLPRQIPTSDGGRRSLNRDEGLTPAGARKEGERHLPMRSSKKCTKPPSPAPGLDVAPGRSVAPVEVEGAGALQGALDREAVERSRWSNACKSRPARPAPPSRPSPRAPPAFSTANYESGRCSKLQTGDEAGGGAEHSVPWEA